MKIYQNIQLFSFQNRPRSFINMSYQTIFKQRGIFFQNKPVLSKQTRKLNQNKPENVYQSKLDSFIKIDQIVVSKYIHIRPSTFIKI